MIWRKSENLDFQLFPKQKRPYFLAFVIKVKYNFIYIRPTVQVFVVEIFEEILEEILEVCFELAAFNLPLPPYLRQFDIFS